jgi:hypothetical protein
VVLNRVLGERIDLCRVGLPPSRDDVIDHGDYVCGCVGAKSGDFALESDDLHHMEELGNLKIRRQSIGVVTRKRLGGSR